MSIVPVPELREWNKCLTLDPLDPGDPTETRYLPLKESGHAAVDEMQATIELAFETTTQLLSGPSGSGKTTELRRLRRDLAARGFQATIFDVTRYVSESSPIDITEFLIALALGAHAALGGPQDAAKPDFGERLRGLFARLSISLEFGGVSAKASRDGVEVGAFGASAEVNLERELKSSEPFVKELREKLSYHVGTLYEEVAEFLAELLPTDDSVGAVLIVDGLEKLRGTTENDVTVQESIEALFVNHASKLRFKSHHMVYTVPTYLQFTAPGALPYDARVMPVPVPHVKPRPGQSPDSVQPTIAQLRKVVGLRIPTEQIFAGEDLDLLILASGGHLRDLFTLLKQVVNLILRRSLTLPLTADTIEEAIQFIGHDFSSITAEQERFLRMVASGDGTVHPTAAEVQLMARLLQSHMLLGHMNGQDWYEVHPLARRALGLD